MTPMFLPESDEAAATPRERDAYARLAEGRRLADDPGEHDQSDEPEQAIALFDGLIDELADAPDLSFRLCRAEAMFRKSQALFDLGRVDGALDLCRDLVARYGQAADGLPLRQMACHALWITAFSLRSDEAGREETIVALCDEGIARFGGESELWMRQRVLHFMIDKSFALDKLARRQDGVALRNAVLARYADDPHLPLREHAGRVLAAMDERFGVQDAEKLENAAR